MSLFISEACAQTAPSGAPPSSMGLGGLLFPILLFVVFYFFLIRPQQKKAREHRTMVQALAKGDEVLTNGGVLGRITRLDDQFIALEVAEGLEIKVQRQAVASLVPKGTLKASL